MEARKFENSERLMEIEQDQNLNITSKKRVVKHGDPTFDYASLKYGICTTLRN
jgi:hypothetical protein